MNPATRLARLFALAPLALLSFAACSSAPPADGAAPCAPQCGGSVCGGDGCGGTCGACPDDESCQDGACHGVDGTCAPACSGRRCGTDGCGGTCGTCGEGRWCQSGACVASGGDAGPGGDTGAGHTGSEAGRDDASGGGGGSGSSGGGHHGSGDASTGEDATGSPDVTWGPPCIYNFGSSCPFPPGQECGNHQSIEVTFPNGPQLLNATLFSGHDCSPAALTDNLNDRQTKMSTGIWMFTDDADVAGVSASNPTSAIWWVGPLTTSGGPPAGAPTTGCINYSTALPMCH